LKWIGEIFKGHHCLLSYVLHGSGIFIIYPIIHLGKEMMGIVIIFLMLIIEIDNNFDLIIIFGLK